ALMGLAESAIAAAAKRHNSHNTPAAAPSSSSVPSAATTIAPATATPITNPTASASTATSPTLTLGSPRLPGARIRTKGFEIEISVGTHMAVGVALCLILSLLINVYLLLYHL